MACDPDHKSQGFGSATVADSLRWVAGQGGAVAILYGHPGYYPRFGFAAVFSNSSTTWSVTDTDGPPLERATPADLPELLCRYNQCLGEYPLAVTRPDAGRELLAGLSAEARRRDLEKVRLGLPHDHLLARLAWLQGAERGLLFGDRTVLAASRAELVQLVLGYRCAHKRKEPLHMHDASQIGFRRFEMTDLPLIHRCFIGLSG